MSYDNTALLIPMLALVVMFFMIAIVAIINANAEEIDNEVVENGRTMLEQYKTNNKNDEPKNELDTMYSDKKYKSIDRPHTFGKAVIPFIGVWDEAKLQDGLSWCIDDSVSFTLEHNFINAFRAWGEKLHKISDDFHFQKKTTCSNVDVEVVYEIKDHETLDAETITTYGAGDNIIHSKVILYPNTHYQRDGYEYNIEYEHNGVDEDKGKIDGAFYRWYYNVMKHEVGHVLGLDHTENPNYVMNQYNNYEKNVPLSGCEAAAAIKKNFVDRNLEKVICEPS